MNLDKAPSFYDVSDWRKVKKYQTKGTRNKSILIEPKKESYYYFKTSFNQGDRDYKHEFWSEIIASYIGRYLGFNTLTYNIALRGNILGCLSENMTIDGTNSLFEGISILTSVDNSYDANKKNNYKSYTLETIYNALDVYKIKHEVFNKMLLFDFIIGNSDRHQVNWGFISTNKNDFEHKLFLKARKITLIRKILKFLICKKIRSTISKKLMSTQMHNEFSPLYDNGSSLGRELEDEKIDKILKKDDMFNGFMNRATSEVRKADGRKFKQKEIVLEIKNCDPGCLSRFQESLKTNYHKNVLFNIINNIDVNLPENLSKFSFPQNRKDFVYKIIDERIKFIMSL